MTTSSAAHDAHEAQLIAVWGAAGAPGRTTVAIALAESLAASGELVALVDADTYGASVATQLGLPDEASGFAALCRRVDSGLTVRAGDFAYSVETDGTPLAVLTGVPPFRWPELSERRVRAGLAGLVAAYDRVVVDVGFNLEADEEIVSDLFAPRRNAATLAVLSAADVVVSVVRADRVGVARFTAARPALLQAAPTATHLTVLNRGTRDAARAHATALERFAGVRVDAVLPEGHPSRVVADLGRRLTRVDLDSVQCRRSVIS